MLASSGELLHNFGMSQHQSLDKWGVHTGYDAFVAAAHEELVATSAQVLESIDVETVRTSLRHPNGFLVRVLNSDETGQLRLHIWPTDRQGDQAPHSHPWHLSSLVLAGTYPEYLPDVQMTDGGSHEIMIPVLNEQRQYTGITSTGRTVDFDLGNLHEYAAGEQHVLPAGAYHATPLPGGSPLITLARTGPQLYGAPSFLREITSADDPPMSVIDRMPPTPAEAEAIWAEIEAIL